MDRIIGKFSSILGGPTLLCTAGIHGSEPAGVTAAERVVAHLKANSIPLRGSFIAARGNMQALKKGIRYIDEDLNRMWIEEDVNRLINSDEEDTSVAEYAEMKPLAQLLHETIRSVPEPILYVDLHTTSSECPPFIYSVPCLNRDQILPRLHIPIVDDPNSCIIGTVGHYVANLGHQVIIAEGGRHDRHNSIEYCEGVLWLALEMIGCVAKEDVEEKHEWAEKMLRHAGAEMPQHYEVVYRHRVHGGDGFRMRPGYHSFQPVERGEVLAEDYSGEIVAAVNGWIVMPLYKPPCDDGFLIVQERESRAAI